MGMLVQLDILKNHNLIKIQLKTNTKEKVDKIEKI